MEQLDEQYQALCKRWSQAGHRDPFVEATMRAELRPEMEQLAARYLGLYEKTKALMPILRLLALFELFRSTEVGLQTFRMASIGKRLRAKWPPPASNGSPQLTSADNLMNARSGTPIARRRYLRSEDVHEVSARQIPQYEMEEIPLWTSTSDPQAPMAYENVVLVHCGFIDNDLVIVLDANLSSIAYGKEAISAKKVQAKWFSEYGYDPVVMNIETGFYPPIVRTGIRQSVLNCATRLHSTFNKEGNPRVLRSVFEESMEELDDLLSFTNIESYVNSFASDRGINADDVCIVWLPFDFLFRLPLAFLGHSFGRPLLQTFGGVSCALSLVTMKYSVMKNHWMSGRHRIGRRPRCVIFSADPKGTLDLDGEIQRVAKHFPTTDLAVFRNASSSEFAAFSNAGEILWFCGHGAANRQRIDSRARFQFLQSGPQFFDRVVSNYELISVPKYNFESVWIMVMNCCMLGESEMIGSNPIGFMTATYAAGAIACVSNLWAVRDDSALEMADELATAIQLNYSRSDFPRARSLNRALRNCVDANPAETWRFASYALWGLP